MKEIKIYVSLSLASNDIVKLLDRKNTPVNQLGAVEFDRMIIEMFLDEFNLTGGE